MKKLIFAILVCGAIVSCAKDDIVSQNQEAIGFKNAFVDNSVRSVNDPTITKENLVDNEFGVYAFVEKAALLTNERVYGTPWKYDATQYWIYGANYNFCAIAPYKGAAWTASAEVSDDYVSTFTINFTNSGTQDLLFANAGKIQGQASGDNDEVAFTFGHLLSKVKFSFKNAYNASNAKIRVENVTIHNAYTSAVATVVAAADATYTASWASHATDLVLSFGNAAVAAADAEETIAINAQAESYNELLLIPGAVPTQTIKGVETPGYNVTFKVDLLVSGTKVKTYNHVSYVNFTPEAGKSYNIKAVVNAENIDPEHAQDPIVFTVTAVNGWDNGNTADSDEDGVKDNTPIE